MPMVVIEYEYPERDYARERHDDIEGFKGVIGAFGLIFGMTLLFALGISAL